jgi:hypothetical protein
MIMSQSGRHVNVIQEPRSCHDFLEPYPEGQSKQQLLHSRIIYLYLKLLISPFENAGDRVRWFSCRLIHPHDF